MATSLLNAFSEATIGQRLALVALVLALGILAQQLFSRRRLVELPANSAALRERLHMMDERAAAAERELNTVAAMLNAIPGPVWRLDPAGNLAWANRYYHGLSADALAALDAAQANKIVTLPGDPPHAFDICSASDDSSGDAPDNTADTPARIHFGLPADHLLETQASLRRFVETLTQTFAHLPIGLAIFDRDRRLNLFNPALSDLLALDPSWLAGRPKFRAVMERLRASGRMPDRAEFQTWLHHLNAMEATAADTGYHDTWLLPGGQNLRATGQPHPDGALAFVFEDMTQLSHVESRHRTDIVLNQAILDQMDEAVAVFDTTGALVFANQTFDRLWDIDSGATLRAPDIHTLVTRWARLGGAAQHWAALTAHVSGGAERQSGQTLLDVPGHGAMLCIWATLPDASALVYFKPPPTPTRWSKLVAPLARALAPTAPNSAEDELAALRLAVAKILQQSDRPSPAIKPAEMVE